MTLKLFAAPGVEPITLAEAKLHLRVDHDTEDALINIFVISARQKAEHATGRAFITQTWDQVIKEFPAGDIPLGKPPVQAVTSITYVDTAGTTQTLGPASYVLDNVSVPPAVCLASGYAWPATADVPNAVCVRFVCGYGRMGKDVPADARQWMLLHIGAAYRNRETFAQNQTVAELPSRYADSLLDSLQTYA